jgi:hypothetical protein
MGHWQVPTQGVPTERIMLDRAFIRGFDEVRAGRPFDYFADDAWEYERGRLFAYIAPISMPLPESGELNRRAKFLFEAAWD